MSGVRTPKLVGTGCYLLMWPTTILLIAGDWRWWQGWCYGVWLVALCVTCIAWLYRRDPALLAERYRAPGTGGQVGWDRFVVYGLLIGFIAWIAIMPLDAKRYRWTPSLPRGVEAAGGVLLAISFFLFLRAFTDNTFLSPLVRIQTEREQQVVSTGVYGFVRHPMYLGATCMFVGAPFLLGSAFGLLVGVGLSALLAVRIVGEERLLVSELEGYEAYRGRVRYRLIPFVW